MSIIKSIKQVLGLGPAAENHFWDGSVANQLTLKRGTPDAPGTELLKALNGVLSFPTLKVVASGDGHAFLTNNVCLVWGATVSDGSGNASFSFGGITFDFVPKMFCQIISNGANVGTVSVESITTTGATIKTANGGTPGALTVGYLVVGVAG